MNAFKNHTTTTAPLGQVEAAQLIACMAAELHAAGEILLAMRHFGSETQLLHARIDLQQRGLIESHMLRTPERQAILDLAKQYRAASAVTSAGTAATRDLVRRLRTVAGQSTIKAPALDLEAADHLEELARRAAKLTRSAGRLDKLLQLCTEAKPKFGPDGKIRAMTMTFKTSVETARGYRDELCKLIDEMEPTYANAAYTTPAQHD